MMKKLFSLLTALVFCLALAACGGRQPEDETVPIPRPQENNHDNAEETPGFDSAANVTDLTEGTVNPETIPGKIRSCFYGKENRLFFLSDQIYLYDTKKDEILASIPAAEQQISIKTFDGGYLISAIENGSVVSTIYDDSLMEKERLVLSELMNDDFILEDAVTIAKDGKQIAFAGMHGIYLYDLENKSASVLQKVEDISAIDGTGISILNQLDFSDNGKDVIYAGLGHSVPVIDGEDGFSVYGSIAIDGSSQQITKKDSYEVESLYVYGNTLLMPQIFTNADGTLLMADLTTKAEKMFRFSSGQEGKDGVFCSSQGNYVATAVLGEGIKIRIYDVATGELLCDETISNMEESYFFRVPQVMILDGSRTCIVFMGHGISDMETATHIFEF